MTLVRWIILFFISSIAVFVLTVAFRLGAFKPVIIGESNYKEMQLLYKEHRGAYDKIAGVISEVEKYALANNIGCGKTFGEYFDDPRQVEERQLRSIGGCVTNTLVTNPPEGYAVKTVPAKSYVLATFEGAPSIGPMKVYPSVQKYMEQMHYKISGSVIEVYTIINNSQAVTDYLFTYEKSSP